MGLAHASETTTNKVFRGRGVCASGEATAPKLGTDVHPSKFALKLKVCGCVVFASNHDYGRLTPGDVVAYILRLKIVAHCGASIEKEAGKATLLLGRVVLTK